jgi:hypothetical protein
MNEARLRIQRQIIGALLHNPALIEAVRSGLGEYHLDPSVRPIFRLITGGPIRVKAAIKATDLSSAAQAAKRLHDSTTALAADRVVSLAKMLLPEPNHLGHEPICWDDPQDDVWPSPNQLRSGPARTDEINEINEETRLRGMAPRLDRWSSRTRRQPERRPQRSGDQGVGGPTAERANSWISFAAVSETGCGCPGP